MSVRKTESGKKNKPELDEQNEEGERERRGERMREEGDGRKYQKAIEKKNVHKILGNLPAL